MLEAESTFRPVRMEALDVGRRPVIENVVEYWLGSFTSQTTRGAYGHDMHLFAAWLGGRLGHPEMDVRTAAALVLRGEQRQAIVMAVEWIQSMESLAARTVRRRICSLRSLVSYAHDLGLVQWTLHNRLLSQRMPRLQRSTRRGPELDRIAELLIELGRDKPTEDIPGHRVQDRQRAWRRDIAIFWLLFGTGIRIGSLARMTVGDVDLANGEIWITAKGQHDPEPVPLSLAVAKRLREWLQEHPFRTDREASLWPVSRGRRQPMAARSIYRMVRRRGLRYGMDLSPHLCRHAMITVCLDEKVGIESAAALAGHDVSVAQKHYDDRRRSQRARAAADAVGSAIERKMQGGR